MARYNCSECQQSFDEEWEIDFHQDNFGNDHVPIPTGEPAYE